MVELGRLRALFDPLMEALPNIGVLAVLAVGAWRVDQGLITPGTLVTFAYLFRLVAMPCGCSPGCWRRCHGPSSDGIGSRR
jgi:ATP-binding cassette, subfamily B, bacterial